MRLEHINLVVKELEPTLDFLLAAFPEWKVRGKGENVWGTTQRHWLHIGNDDYYITLNDSAEGEIRDIHGITPGLAHIGFVVDDLAGLINRLTAKGYAIYSNGRNHPFRKTAYFCDPAGYQFEFMQYSSEKPEEKNMYGGETGELKRNVSIKEKPMNNERATQIIQSLYQAVDNKNLDYLNTVLADSIHFRIGNNPTISDKQSVLEANRAFFNSIKSMDHTIDRIWNMGNDILCNGLVDYSRLDGSRHSAHFSTALTVENNQITDYYVYADISEL